MRDDLSPRAREFLDAAKHADDPSSDDHARIRARVLAVAAGGVASGAASAAAASATAAATSGAAASSGVAVGGIASLGSVAAKGLLLLALVGAGTAGVIRVSQQADVPAEIGAPAADTPATESRRSAPLTAAAPEPGIAEAPPETAQDPVAALPPPPSMPAATPRLPRALPESSEVATPIAPTPTLANELSILRAAQRARSASDPRAALRHLDEHARQFPLGALAEERDGTRVFALCDAGEIADARAAADAFLAAHPQSPLRQRVSVTCR